jgi:hypothetical protein
MLPVIAADVPFGAEFTEPVSGMGIKPSLGRVHLYTMESALLAVAFTEIFIAALEHNVWAVGVARPDTSGNTVMVATVGIPGHAAEYIGITVNK